MNEFTKDETQVVLKPSLIAPSETSRAILFQALENREVKDKVSPEFFLAHYMKFVNMTIAHGSPSKDTQHTYNSHISLFLDWCLTAARVSPFKLKPVHLELYRSMLYKKKTVNGTNYNANTIYLALVAIRAFYQAAMKQGIINENPCADVKSEVIHVNDLPFAYFKMDEIKELIEYTKKNGTEFEIYRNLVLIYLMGVAGLRCVEVHRANQEDINWNDFTMVVRGKGHNGLSYLDDSTARVIQDYLDCLERLGIQPKADNTGTPLLVTNSTNRVGNRLARDSIRWNMNRILKGAGLKQNGFACHVLRHSCATALYEATHDLRVVQDTLRHRDPTVTARYAHVVEQLQNRPTGILGNMLREG